jgi:hypothetical protein
MIKTSKKIVYKKKFLFRNKNITIIINAQLKKSISQFSHISLIGLFI